MLQYARVEKTLLDAKNLGQNHEKKIKELQKEIDLLNGKIKQQANDKTRICGILDEKCKVAFLLFHSFSLFNCTFRS